MNIFGGLVKNSVQALVLAVCLLAATACSSGKNPGPLEGTWQLDGFVPMTVIYRQGEEEAMGLIDKVTYKRDGNDVLVTYTDGMAKGTTLRITMTGPDTATTSLGNLRRIK